MAFAVKSSDSFNRTDGAIGTLDNAAGGSESGNTWSDTAGAWEIVTNRARNDTADSVAYVGSTANVADQRVSAKWISNGALAVVARWAVGTGGPGNFYLTYVVDGSFVVQLYIFINGSGFTQLGSDGGTTVTTDKVSVQCVGTAISALKNDVVVVGPSTNATLATGKPGMYGQSGQRLFDDFLYETDEGAAFIARPPLLLNQAVMQAATW